MSSSLQNILMLAGVVLIAALGYYVFVQNGSADLRNTQVDNSASAETAMFLQRLNDLQSIKLDGAIFTDQRFSNFFDFSQPITPVSVGKPDPFTETN
mgnify:CR=1 FL=1